jgi:hypothetical protein
LNITKATATITLSTLSQVYDGTPRAVTATTTPAALNVVITYDGNPSAPTNAGSYAVVATVNDINYEGSASDTLAIAKADQAITFITPATNPVSVAKKSTVTLNATTNSGLPVTFTVNGGTLNGSSLYVGNSPIAIVVTASQTGDSNYNAATATTTINVTSN